MMEKLGCVPVIVETDSLELVQAFDGVIQILHVPAVLHRWRMLPPPLPICSASISNTHGLQIASRIGNISMQQEKNMVAHTSARHAFTSNSCVLRVIPVALLSRL